MKKKELKVIIDRIKNQSIKYEPNEFYNGLPVPKAFILELKDYVVSIVCPYCYEVHKHGSSGIGDHNSHRIAHCLDPEINNKAGYFIDIENYERRLKRKEWYKKNQEKIKEQEI